MHNRLSDSIRLSALMLGSVAVVFYLWAVVIF